MPFQICKNFCKILNNLIFNQKKTKNVTGCFLLVFAKLCNKLVQIKLNCRNLTEWNLHDSAGNISRIKILPSEYSRIIKGPKLF